MLKFDTRENRDAIYAPDTPRKVPRNQVSRRAVIPTVHHLDLRQCAEGEHWAGMGPISVLISPHDASVERDTAADAAMTNVR